MLTEADDEEGLLADVDSVPKRLAVCVGLWNSKPLEADDDRVDLTGARADFGRTTGGNAA